ncbi:DUF4136 domain-containing protein [Roseomonas eburnea]|uniref:DUF4136 domain-containing protein n=1 Tax=Neoroseomonas eburnea TaxID=1346889 RepID=A0A9X9XK57_9PROT|nr:DUF4136 domain-containing protein [Neoroseomonas eburnea]MBR0684093.1 DUF4136 domain-containing protein [Neoroseomonas eburnea]
MPVRRFLPHLLLALGLGACATVPRVHVDQDPTADFARYRTFGWASPLGTDSFGYTSLTTERFKAAVEREMTARGYVMAPNPDLLVNFSGRLRERTRVETMPAPPIGYYGYRFYGAWPAYAFGATTYVDQYTEGTLNVDLVDRARNALVWEGVAVGRVTQADREHAAERIAAAVAAVFARFPYRAPAAPQR